MAKSFRDFFDKDENKETVKDILRAVRLDQSEEEQGDTLAGMIFVITGSLNHFDNRDALKDRLEKAGARVAGSVSAKTSYLINNDVTSSSGKNKKAKELGIPIITEEDFLKMLQ